MEIRTELPEKWYVVRIPENAQVLNDWADSVVEDAEIWDRRETGIVVEDGSSYGPNAKLFIIALRTQITYEEFTKLVLKKNL